MKWIVNLINKTLRDVDGLSQGNSSAEAKIIHPNTYRVFLPEDPQGGRDPLFKVPDTALSLVDNFWEPAWAGEKCWGSGATQTKASSPALPLTGCMTPGNLIYQFKL